MERYSGAERGRVLLQRVRAATSMEQMEACVPELEALISAAAAALRRPLPPSAGLLSAAGANPRARQHAAAAASSPSLLPPPPSPPLSPPSARTSRGSPAHGGGGGAAAQQGEDVTARVAALSVLVAAVARGVGGRCCTPAEAERIAGTAGTQRAAAVTRAVGLLERVGGQLAALTGGGEAEGGGGGASAAGRAARLGLAYGLCQMAQCRATLAALTTRAITRDALRADGDPDAIAAAVLDLTRLAPPPLAAAATAAASAPPAAVEAGAELTPVRDPVTHAPMQLPARGLGCRHLACFDVKGFVRLARQGSAARLAANHAEAPCPVCGARTRVEALRVDLAALEALRRHREQQGAALSPSTAAAAAKAGSASSDLLFRWERRPDGGVGCCTVVPGKRTREEAGELAAADDDDSDREGEQRQGGQQSQGADDGAPEPKRRRVEINGAVVYMEE